MDLQEFCYELEQTKKEGQLVLDPLICEGVFGRLFFAAGLITVEDCIVKQLSDHVLIRGNCRIDNWYKKGMFSVEIKCREQNSVIEYRASFWCGLRGTLSDFFGEVSPTLVWNADGKSQGIGLVADFPVFLPVLTFDSQSFDTTFPLTFCAGTKTPADSRWGIYSAMLTDINTVSGRVNREGQFELEASLYKNISGFFSGGSMALLLRNGAEYEENYKYPAISQAGLRIRLTMPQVSEVDFTLPLFTRSGQWNLHAFFPGGFGVADIVNFLTELFGIGGSAASLCLPLEAPLNQFKLYKMDILTERKQLSLHMRYLTIEFALEKPWIMPIPYLTLDRLGVGFQVTFGDKNQWGNLLTAAAAGSLSLKLGKWVLSMDMEMDLPEMDFEAKLHLAAETAGKAEGPGISDLAGTFGAELPADWKTQQNFLGEITVYGSGSGRYFHIQAEVRNLLSFSVGNLSVNIAEISAQASVTTSDFSVSFQGIMEFGEAEDSFSFYLKADYQNPGWQFSGGLYQGRVNIGRLLSQMFGLKDTAEDIFSLALSEFAISYAVPAGEFSLTAAFEAGWNITVLGENLVLGGRVMVYKQKETETDVSALAYMTLGDFRVLIQIDHIQKMETRSFLFRLEYGRAYLQAAWFRRQEEEILSVNLGGMTLGELVESIVNKINPNMRFTLEAPWNLLNRIELVKFLFEWNVTKKQASFVYQAQLSIAGLMYLDTVGVRYDMKQRRVFFVLTGKLLGVSYGEENPVTWDAVNGQPPAGSAEDQKKFELYYLGMGQHLKNNGIAQADGIREAMQALKDQISPPQTQGRLPDEVGYDAESNWLFGADFTINEAINIKLILNDPDLYGILATVNAKPGSALEFFDGFGLELLYKRVTSHVYLFRGELLVPEKYRNFQLGIASLTLGRIQVEIYTNGGFYVALGFPHKMDFTNSFVLQWGIFTGRGGIYFGIMKDIPKPDLPAVINGNFSPIAVLGLGLSVGLGRSFDFGIVKGGVSAEVFGIFEGVLAVFHEKDTGKEALYYYVKASAGIAGRLYVSVDFKIITIQASAEIMASAALTLQAYKKTLVELDLSLKLQASIKILFIKIKFSFSFHHHMTFTMGEDERTPWIEEGERQTSESRENILPVLCVNSLVPVTLDYQNINLKIVPMFYLHQPSREPGRKNTYGAAFLMMMDGKALKLLTGLLTGWILSHFPGDVIRRMDAEELSPELADTMTYRVLEEFLGRNVFISYEIHWAQGELSMEEAFGEEQDGYVFPMLPSLQISFGEEGKEKKVRYWDEVFVEEDYFTELSGYFKKLNPDPSCEGKNSGSLQEKDDQNKDELNENKLDGSMPVAKAFFQDYFKLFLRELIGNIQGIYEQCRIENGIVTASEEFGISVTELLRQNQELVFAEGQSLRFPRLNYVVTAGDTVEGLQKRFRAKTDELWDSLKHETFLLEQGSRIAFGEGSFTAGNLTLKETAAVLFVRFYEESAPEDMIYAGDIVRQNEGLDMSWEETEPGKRSLMLPGWEKEYHTLRGDTPQRLGKFVSLLDAEMGSLPEWKAFYEDICRRNQEGEEKISRILFCVPWITVCRDLDLGGLSARIYPDYREEEAPTDKLFGAKILKANTPVIIPNAVYTVSDGEPVTPALVMNAMPCTWEELGQAVREDRVFKPGQEIHAAGVNIVKKTEILRRLQKEADSVGAALSRFLLQGLKILDPCGREENLVPLYQALQQQFPMEMENTDMVLAVSSLEPDCAWVQRGEKKVRMGWEKIALELPGTDFTALPEKFEQSEDFLASDQYLTIPKTVSCYRGKECLSIQRFSEAMEDVLRMGSAVPKLLDQKGAEEKVSWGCMIPLEIGLCGEDDIFSLYGAGAKTRLTLQKLLDLPNIKIHFMYQASEVSKGDQSFHEYQWLETESCLVKTNLSVETHMEPMREAGNAADIYFADLTRQRDLLRLIWQCSTVGGGGYYFRLITEDGRTLPSEIFDEAGGGVLWLLAEAEEYDSLAACINCSITMDTAARKKTLTLVTADKLQRVMQPRFPAGCIGLYSSAKIPPEEETSKEALLRRLFQITGYRLRETPGQFTASNLSAPIVPEEAEGRWFYRPVAPVYRYAISGGGTPYSAVGKTARVVLEARDVLGNSLEMGETTITPCYNDVLTGIGQWAASRVSYEIAGTSEQPFLRLTFEPCLGEKWSAEAGAYQKRAAQQIACEDIEVIFRSPVNGASYLFSKEMQGEYSYLQLLRNYGAALADILEGKTAEKLEAWSIDFPLDTKEYPLWDDIFRLRAVLTVERSPQLAKEPSARTASTEVCPYFRESAEANAGVLSGEKEEETRNLVYFSRKARTALPELLLAQKGEGDGALYGITCKENGFLKKISIKPFTYTDYEKGENRIEAPEFYALRPLYHGALSRSANVRDLQEDGTFGTQWNCVEAADVDMEIWAMDFLGDIETLLLPAQIKRAGMLCKDALARIMDAKSRLAEAVSQQMAPLWQNGRKPGKDLRARVCDRLKRSLKEGYRMDIAAGFMLEMETREYCRLTTSFHSGIEGAQATAGKAETGNDRLYLFFTNEFREKSIPLAAELILKELEYGITQDGGYESSHWLKFVEPIELPLIKSQIDLPNPLKSCPQPPVLEAQSCEIGFTESENGGIFCLSPVGSQVCWEYGLTFGCRWREQDTLFIRVEFESQAEVKAGADGYDLFDVLAEYSLARNALWKDFSGADTLVCRNAFYSFAELAEHAAQVWEDWITGDNRRMAGYHAGQSQVYSCTAQGVRTETGLCFELVSTEEGRAFLDKYKIPVPVLEVVENTKPGEEIQLHFAMKQLPLYQCAQAEPSVKIIRNQNLLFAREEKRYLPVNEDFIYRTQPVSLPPLPVTGEYTREYILGTVKAKSMAQEQLEQVIALLFRTLLLENEHLMISFSVSYYYGLTRGKENPRVLLPVTLVPVTETTDASGKSEALQKTLGENLYAWYQEVSPERNCSGMLFDLKVYKRNGQQQLLHFSKLNVRFAISDNNSD
ncbi:hypothetical protein [Eisenbergiella tayi]|uniref:hypothetical protein n=1 Tax=Eisenbergiella tayi TaxID=1432052 RepID=UPI002A8089F5|nr:hypothetical protein [Eisenbergiella tayi]